jgi:hypothetical protein
MCMIFTYNLIDKVSQCYNLSAKYNYKVERNDQSITAASILPLLVLQQWELLRNANKQRTLQYIKRENKGINHVIV